jgi:hypothetical protein
MRLCVDSINSLPVGRRRDSISLRILSEPGNVLCYRSNTTSSSTLNVVLQASAVRGLNLRGDVSAMISTALKQESQLSELNSSTKITVLAMSAWDVMPALPPEMPGIMVRFHLPGIRRSSFHTKSECVEWERLETKVFPSCVHGFAYDTACLCTEAFKLYQVLHCRVGTKTS